MGCEERGTTRCRGGPGRRGGAGLRAARTLTGSPRRTKAGPSRAAPHLPQRGATAPARRPARLRRGEEENGAGSATAGAANRELLRVRGGPGGTRGGSRGTHARRVEGARLRGGACGVSVCRESGVSPEGARGWALPFAPTVTASSPPRSPLVFPVTPCRTAHLAGSLQPCSSSAPSKCLV